MLGGMLLDIEPGVADLAATKFSISPLSETELDRRPLRVPRLWPLIVTGLPYWPEFLVPASLGKSPRFEEELTGLVDRQRSGRTGAVATASS
jgi:hypothetical protein